MMMIMMMMKIIRLMTLLILTRLQGYTMLISDIID